MSETTIELPESLTIHHIEALFGDLKLAFQSDADSIKIDGNKVEAIDTSGLQALLALIKSAQSNNKSIQWQSAAEVLKTSAEKIGLASKLLLK